MGIKIYDIDWETDGIDIKELNLPTEVEIPNEVDEDEIADYLSDNYGFLVNSFDYNEEDFE